MCMGSMLKKKIRDEVKVGVMSMEVQRENGQLCMDLEYAGGWIWLHGEGGLLWSEQ